MPSSAWSVTGVQTCALPIRSEEHTSELQSLTNLVCRLLLEKKKSTDDADVRVRFATGEARTAAEIDAGPESGSSSTDTQRGVYAGAAPDLSTLTLASADTP